MENNYSGKISVIIPIFNTASYLKRCLNSVCNQSYQKLEIICVDDGSTDGSEKILDEFAKRDSRIIAVHQENHGESYARNIGLNYVTGEFIAFVDCDDWLELDMYEKLHSLMNKEKLDLAAGSWFQSNDNNDIAIKNKKNVVDGIPFSQSDLLNYIYMRDDYKGFAYMWDKLYRKKILINEQGHFIKFDESLKLGGDVLFLAMAALKVEKAAYINEPFYHYYQRENSGVHSLSSEKMKDWITAYEKVIALMVQNGTDSLTINYVKRFMAYHASNGVIVAVKEKKNNEKIYFQNIMKKNKEEYCSLNLSNLERIKEFNRRMEL